MRQSSWLVLGAFIWIAHGIFFFASFHIYAPQLYMDEPFHVPQTQHYCHGRFDVWDPKITTLPGLYAVGAAYAHSVKGFFDTLATASGYRTVNLATACGTTSLRFLNVVAGWACLILLYHVHRRLHPGNDWLRSAAWAATLAAYPLHWFFQFLYYSDVLSLTTVIAAHLACLRRRYTLAAAVSAAAVLMRQTNAVWAVFHLGVGVMQECHLDKHSDSSLLGDLATLGRCLSQRGTSLVKRCGPLAAVPAAFVVFVRLNGGIVVGDRTAHAAVPHLVQPLYFALFTAIAMGPALLAPERLAVLRGHAIRQPAKSTAVFVAAMAAAVAVVDNYTVAHPYLLSDNRHFTFYIWKDVLGVSPWLRRAVVPLYLVSGMLLISAASAAQSPLWVATWLACTCTVLVPSALVEFRYFTVPFILLALHMEPPKSHQICCIAAAWTAVNAITAWLFLMKPFTWPDGSIARFMW